MIRALYTAASGMNAQQANIDNVAHNLANVNTTGFKKSRVEFEDLVYETTRAAGTPTSARRKRRSASRPGSARARSPPRATSRRGNLQVDRAARSTWRSRATASSRSRCRTARPATPAPATLHLDAEGKLVTAEGMRSSRKSPIPPNATSVSISKEGMVSVSVRRPERGAAGRHHRARHVPEPGRPARARRQPLRRHHRVGRCRRPACRAPTASARFTQGFLEDSNVSVVEEMVNMILGQRAYEANSRVIKAADEMLAQVNNLGALGRCPAGSHGTVAWPTPRKRRRTRCGRRLSPRCRPGPVQSLPSKSICASRR